MADDGDGWDCDGAPLDPARLPSGLKPHTEFARWCAEWQQSFETESRCTAEDRVPFDAACRGSSSPSNAHCCIHGSISKT
jgi:hypothetical protein